MKVQSTRFYILLTVLLFALLVVAPLHAQDVTPESTEQATVAPVATVVPIETPVPAPTPAPIDQSQIPTWAIVIVIAVVLGFVSISTVGIVQAAKGAPPWLQDILMSGTNAGLNALGNYAVTTATTVDDDLVAELRKRIEALEQQIKAPTVTTTPNVSVTLNPPPETGLG